MEPREGGFDEYRRLILQSLEQLGKDIAGINTKIDEMRRNDLEGMKIDIAMLKVKAGMWGAVGGAAGGAIIAALVGKLVK